MLFKWYYAVLYLFCVILPWPVVTAFIVIGDQVVVGACGSGRNPDCPNDSIYYDNSYHQILCCTIPEFNWNHCESYGSEHGVLNSCLEHGEVPTILEGTCGSGT